MTYEMLRTVFIAGAVLSVLMLLISVFLFLFLNIPMIIGELTGTNARKGIAQIRNKAGQSIGNNQTGKLARGVVSSIIDHQSSPGGGAENDITEKMITEELYQAGAEDETALLGDMQQDETFLLDNREPDAAALLENIHQSSHTALLTEAPGESDRETAAGNAYGLSTEPDFEIEYEITYIHTDEKIDQ